MSHHTGVAITIGTTLSRKGGVSGPLGRKRWAKCLFLEITNQRFTFGTAANRQFYRHSLGGKSWHWIHLPHPPSLSVLLENGNLPWAPWRLAWKTDLVELGLCSGSCSVPSFPKPGLCARLLCDYTAHTQPSAFCLT